MNKYALSRTFERSGVGLHSGIETTVRVLPASAGAGRYFVRVDLPETPVIAAKVEAVRETMLSTQLQGEAEQANVRTVEHLLAALAASGIADARIEIDGPEVPLLDGSAKNWVEAIREAGVVALGETAAAFLQQQVSVNDGDAFVTAFPAPTLRFSYGIDFDLPAIGNQWHSWTPQEDFGEAIAPARTFALAHQIEQLQNRGLIKGGSLENALVCGEQGWLNGPLRFPNEPVRHKLLDLVGDLSLLGNFPIAHFLSYKASHNLHIQLAKKLAIIFE